MIIEQGRFYIFHRNNSFTNTWKVLQFVKFDNGLFFRDKNGTIDSYNPSEILYEYIPTQAEKLEWL